MAKKIEDYILAPGMPPKATNTTPAPETASLFQSPIQDKGWGAMTQMANDNNTASKPGSVNTPPVFTPQYTQQINTILDGILNAPEFSYDPNKDSSYQSYKTAYMREGRRAMEDTMGEMASLTGGMPSTAATIAGQQQNTLYASKLADTIPQLKQIAYQMYNDKLNNQRSNLSTMMAVDQTGYNQYRDKVGDFQTDRQFDYGVGRDTKNDALAADETAYDRGRDAKLDAINADQTVYNRGQDAKNEAYTLEQDKKAELSTKAQTLASVGVFSGYLSLGYSNEEVRAMEDAYDKGDKRAIADILAQNGDFSMHGEAYGLTPEQIQAATDNYNAPKKAEGASIYAGATGDYSMVGDTYGWTPDQVSAVNQGVADQTAQERADKASSKANTKSGNNLDNLIANMDASSDPYLYLAANYDAYGIDKSQIPNVSSYYAQKKEDAQFDPEVPTTQEMFTIVDNLIKEGYSESEALEILHKSDNVDEQTWANFYSMYDRANNR